MISVPFFYFSL